MNIKAIECVNKECFIPGKDWGHLSHMLCEHLGENKDGSICMKTTSNVQRAVKHLEQAQQLLNKETVPIGKRDILHHTRGRLDLCIALALKL